MSKKASIEETATRFANLKNELAAEKFLDDYKKWFALSDVPNEPVPEPGVRILGSLHPLKKWRQPAEAWQAQSNWLATKRVSIRKRNLLRQITQWSEQLRGAWGENEDAAEDSLAQILDSRRVQTPRQVKLGSAQIEPRDLLDRIAIAILKASERGLLRLCQGHKQGWACPTPYLLADEKRRVYCYMRCGDEAKSLAKRAWWRKNRSPKRRQRAGRNP